MANTIATNKVSNRYDNWGALLSQDYADTTPDVLYTRDNQGNVTDIKTGSLSSGTIASPQTQWTYTYNSQHAIESESLNVDGLTFALNPEYNALGSLNTLTYPNGTVISYLPNALGQAQQAGNYATNALYHPNGLVKSFTYGNQLAFAQTVDSEQRPYQLTAAGNTVKFTYGYDDNNNVTSLVDNVDPSYSLSDFVYDGLDRLKNVTGKWGTGSFTYDVLSNIKTQTLGTTSFTYNYSSTNRLSSVSGAISKTQGYDARGNQTQNGSQTLTFNAANEMVSGNGATYLYDAYHRLVRKTVNGQNTYSVYNASGTLITQYQNGTYTDFIKLGKQTVAEVKNGTATYQHSDVLGSPIAESNNLGQITNRFHYKPFGERMETFTQDDTGYTGHQFDQTLGATYAQQRYLMQDHGRFWSKDPVGYTLQNPVMSFNRYLYANANPYKYNDPDGEFINFAIKFVADVALNAAINYVTTGEVNIGGALQDAALDAINPAATLQKFAKVAAAVQKIDKALDKVGCSFDEDTLVLTKDGLKRIADIRENDVVLARNDESGTEQWQPVTAKFKEWHHSVRVMTFENQQGERETLITTDEHPFYHHDKRWVPAAKLVVGDTILASDNKLLKVIHNVVERKGQDAYNLTVANDHTYFVGHSRAWVHNTCGNGPNLPQSVKISDQQQNAHVKGTLENQRRVDSGKPTSTFDDRETADRLTADTVATGTPSVDSAGTVTYTKEYGTRIGTNTNGADATAVKVHQKSNGVCHGHPCN